MKKKNKQLLIFLKVFLTIAFIVCIAVPNIILAADCPYGGEPESIGSAGCNRCGGSGIDCKKQLNRSDKSDGSGMEVVEQVTGGTKKVTYYRCSNCGDTGYDCKQYEEVVEIKYYRKMGDDWIIDTRNPPQKGSASKAQGYVPIRWCTECGQKLMDRGMDFHTIATWAQKHLSANPTPTPYPTATPLPIPTPITDIHDDNCYTGTVHVHTEDCLQKVNCTNGCKLHSHSGDTYAGTGCYTGTYHEGSSYACGGTYSSRTLLNSETYSDTGMYCSSCQAATSHTYYSEIYSLACSKCGSAYGSYVYEEDICDVCGNNDIEERGESIGDAHIFSTGGYYDLNCGKTGMYCKSGSICSVCHGAGTIGGICDKVAGGYYEGDVLCSPLCPKVLYTIYPLISTTQIIRIGEIPNTKAYVGYYAKTHMTYPDTIEDCIMLDFDSTLYNQEQEVTIQFGGDGYYLNSAKNSEKYITSTIKVQINGTYIVNFHPNGGTITQESKEVVYEQTYDTMPTPDREGYTFDGWYTEKTGGTLILPETSMERTEHHTLYAHWTANTYTVTFDANGGTVSIGTKTITYDSPYGTLPVPTKTGSTFAGWMLGSNGVTEDTIVTTASNHTVKALWIPNTQNVLFDANGGTVGIRSKAVTFGLAYGELPVPTRTGYHFNDWWYGDSIITADSIVTAYESHTLMAGWDPNSYTITWDANGGTCGVSSTMVTIGKGYANTITDMEISRVGYTFDGWYTEPTDGDDAEDGSGIKVYSADKVYVNNGMYWNNGTWIYPDNLTLYAHWKANTYQVTLDGQGATSQLQTSVLITYGKTGPVISVPTKTGYTFMGYFEQPNGAGILYYDKDGVSRTPWKTGEDGIIYAYWTPIKYTVQYIGNGATKGSMDTSRHVYDTGLALTANTYEKEVTVSYEYESTLDGGSTEPVLATLTKQNTIASSSFAGWALSESGVVTYADKEVVKNLTEKNGNIVKLYAKWNPGTVILPDITRVGYTFDGWNATFDGTGTYYASGDTYTVEDSITLYAHWTPKTCTITLDGQSAGTQSQNNVVMTYDKIAPNVVIPIREYYVFGGYYTEPDGNGIQVHDKDGKGLVVWNGTMWENVTTLYAYWTPKEMTGAEVNLIPASIYYITEAVLTSEPELPTLHWREYGDTSLQISVKTDGYFDFAVIDAPWEEDIRVILWEDGTHNEVDNLWTLDNNIVFWRSQLRYEDEEDKVRTYPGYKDQTYTITIYFYMKEEIVKEYKVGLHMIPYSIWREEIIATREGGSWDFNGDGIPDEYLWKNGTKK